MPFLTDAQFNTLKGLQNPLNAKLAEWGFTAPINNQPNEFVNTLINMYWQQATMTSYVDKREYWSNWASTMPNNLAQALLMITVPTDTFQFDINKFVPDKHMVVDTIEQNYITEYKRSSGVSLEPQILMASFNSPQKYQGYVAKYRQSLENSIYRFKWYNIMYQLMFNDRPIKGKRTVKGTTKVDFDYSDLIVPPESTAVVDNTVPKYLNPITQKIFTEPTDKAGNFNNDGFTKLIIHYKNLKIPNQANYNLGDPVDPTRYKFGVPWSEDVDKYILFAPQSVLTRYLTSTNNSIGIAQVFNKKSVDVGMRFSKIVLYDDVSPKTTIRMTNAEGYAMKSVIDNPFYNPPLLNADGTPKTVTLPDNTKSQLYLYNHRFGVFDNKSAMVKTRLYTSLQQSWARNMANTAYLHTWFMSGICPFAQGFVIEFAKSS